MSQQLCDLALPRGHGVQRIQRVSEERHHGVRVLQCEVHAEMLKTRVAHGYRSRHAADEACPYANICEFLPALTDQLADVHALQVDEQRRGWSSESDRHGRVAAALEGS